ncbi:hypothetical protein M885DRAFT_572656 [Pelagophyceae sp. CCMP2097]|nr:hypothetical protein M885DRAFT_572656 [Pelagophyceae sp. CCMP2097]
MRPADARLHEACGAKRAADAAAVEADRLADLDQLEAQLDLPRRTATPWQPLREAEAAVRKSDEADAASWTAGHRRNLYRSERYDCNNVRTTVQDWGKRLAVEAYTFGSLMLHEQLTSASHHSHFLLPGPLTSELQVERIARMAKEFDQVPPTLLWCPTVRAADRGEYEAFAGKEYNAPGPIGITDENADGATKAWPFFTLLPAPPRETYNPITYVWAVADPSSDAKFESLIGLDSQENYQRTLPAELKQRFFEDRKHVAHPAYRQNGVPVEDVSLVVIFPLVEEHCNKAGHCDADSDNPDDSHHPVLGNLIFSLNVNRWASIFPANVKVIGAATGHVIKTVSGNFGEHVRTTEPFLDLHLECYYNVQNGTTLLYIGAIASVIITMLLLLLLWRLESKAALERRVVDERRRESAAAELCKAAADAAQRKDERIQYRFEVNQKTERYLNHELKNRIFVLGQSCADQSLHGQIDEIAEVLNGKAVLMRLSTGRYEPSWDAIEPVSLIDTRWQRFVAANSPFGRAETTGGAAHRTLLLLDKALINICLDNMLSNAFKYGDPSRPPALSLNVEPLDSEASRVRLSLDLRNWAGPEHAALLKLGEEKLNDIAITEGRRAHEHAAELSSGDGFPMAVAAASALGGTIRLVLLPGGVIAKLELPNVAAVLPVAALGSAAAVAAPAELSQLKIAMVDDSSTFRKTFVRLANKVTSQEPIVAGATRESIDAFPKAVVRDDVDVVFLDFNFAPVHHTKTGVDICRECRQLDAEEGTVPRLIFIVSANDSPEDAERYRAAGADGSLSKKLTAETLRQVFEDAMQNHPRFAAHRRGELEVLEIVAAGDVLAAAGP